MSTPHTLAEAFRILGQRQKFPTGNEWSNGVIDILGVVSNISTYSCSAFETTTSCRLPRSPHSQIWLTDDSQVDNAITKRGAAEEFPELFTRPSFVLYGSSEVARIDQEQIKVGDLLRFNRVALKDFDGSLQFRFCFHDPEPGVSWFRLGYIDSQGSFNENNVDDHCSASRIPESMRTSKKRIAELVEWYKNNFHRILPLSSENLPSRRRHLSEIEFTSGILSNVRVKVVKVRSEYVAVANRNAKLGQKKKRSKMLSSVTFAIFTDESGTSMPFIDTSGRFLPKLRSAQNDNDTTFLIITNVYTEYQSNLRGLETSTNEIVLVPTVASSGVLVVVPDIKNSNSVNANPSGTSDIDAMPMHEPSQHFSSREKTVISRMMDVTVNGISLKKTQSVFATASKYLQTILASNDRFFRTAMVDLETKCCYGKVSSSTIEATPDVLKTLCGSLDVDELSSDETLRSYSMGFLRGLINEGVVLEWRLVEDEDKNLTIVKAVLHRIP
mmetsp:Transcript_14303/g.33206  ORF Transcript_14303/g.33206 Transcript_14303/m.33206 type:complete len:499 (+) Transcript_14303:226-1722(+)